MIYSVNNWNFIDKSGFKTVAISNSLWNFANIIAFWILKKMINNDSSLKKS